MVNGKFIQRLVTPLSSVFSQQRLISWTNRKLILPFYHTISDDDLPFISNLYPLRSLKQFRTDIEYFCKHYQPISISELEQYKLNKSGDLPPSFHLTFDDGLKEAYTHIAPLLEEKGIPATFFVNTDFIDNKNLFYRYKVGLLLEEIGKDESNIKALKISKILQQNSKWNLDCRSSLLRLNYHDQTLIDQLGNALGLDFYQWLQENKPYLTSTQIKELIKRGFSFGSHSCDHPRFKNIDFDFQKKQIERSFDFLERTFEIKESYFSFPFGDEEVGKNLFDWMAKEANLDFSFGVSGLKDDYSFSHFHRIPMDMCSGQTEKFIKSEYLYFMIKHIFRKNQIHRE